MNIKFSNTLNILSSAMMFSVLSAASTSSWAVTDVNYERRLIDLEQKFDQLDKPSSASGVPGKQVAGNGFNPAISVILDGIYARYSNHPEDYNLPGYTLGGEAELVQEGFSLGHSEITLSNNIDDKFFGQFTVAIVEHEGAVEVELEEAFFETLALGNSFLGNGFSIRGGRFFSAVGYLNQQHAHAWDFQDAPLVYRGLFGDQYLDDGIRVSYIAPTDVFLEFGAEGFAGNKFPAGGEHNSLDSFVGFINMGGDIGNSHSWQAGISYWQANNIVREYGGHTHDAAAAVEVPHFTGDSTVTGLNAVYKWAPYGNYRDQNFKLQFEYFMRDDEGVVALVGSNPLEVTTLDGNQDGWYLQGVWQFAREWRVGVRYDALDSNNKGTDTGVLGEVGLLNDGHDPRRVSVMTEWVPGEFSRIRLQYNKDDSYQQSDDQVYLQYTFSIGAHGAHSF